MTVPYGTRPRRPVVVSVQLTDSLVNLSVAPGCRHVEMLMNGNAGKQLSTLNLQSPGHESHEPYMQWQERKFCASKLFEMILTMFPTSIIKHVQRLGMPASISPSPARNSELSKSQSHHPPPLKASSNTRSEHRSHPPNQLLRSFCHVQNFPSQSLSAFHCSQTPRGGTSPHAAARSPAWQTEYPWQPIVYRTCRDTCPPRP